jgi:hypothetical protein
MDPNYPKDSLEVFEYLVGKYKRIEKFNKYGDVEFNFKILKGPHEGYHWVSIEPFLLKKKKEGHLTRRCS